MSSGSAITSPRLTPMRNVIRCSSRTSGSRSIIPRWTSAAAHGTDDTGELSQEAVAGVLDDTAVVLGDLRIDQLAEMPLPAFVRTLLIGAHQPRIACDIGGED